MLFPRCGTGHDPHWERGAVEPHAGIYGEPSQDPEHGGGLSALQKELVQLIRTLAGEYEPAPNSGCIYLWATRLPNLEFGGPTSLESLGVAILLDIVGPSSWTQPSHTAAAFPGKAKRSIGPEQPAAGLLWRGQRARGVKLSLRSLNESGLQKCSATGQVVRFPGTPIERPPAAHVCDPAVGAPPRRAALYRACVHLP